MEELRITTPLEVVNPERFPRFEEYAQTLYRLRQRKG
jgi:phosphotransacetylase